MKKNKIMVVLMLLCAQLFFSNNTSAADFYKNDFETGIMPLVGTVNAGQEWSLTPVFTTVYGERNHFLVTSSASHSGNYSLRFTYEGRNGFCNNCGGTTINHKTGLNAVDYYVADTDENLAIVDNPATTKVDDGPKVEPGKIIFNKSAGYSKWEVVSVDNENFTNNKLTLKLLKAGIGGEPAVFNGGDNVTLARQCGKDGIIGVVKGKYDINRRSDCNEVIIWFGNVSAQNEGTSIFRRLYLKQEVTTHFPLQQKLHYFRPNRDGTKGSIKGETVLLAKADELLKHIGSPYPHTGLRHYGGATIYRPTEGLPDNVKFERSAWYYVEEEYKSSTFNSTTGEYNADGEFRLWFAKSGEETNTPIIEETGLQLPALSGGNGTHISLWGNFQHWIHNYGSWYMDDIQISNARVGWIVGAAGNNTAPSQSPKTSP